MAVIKELYSTKLATQPFAQLMKEQNAPIDDNVITSGIPKRLDYSIIAFIFDVLIVVLSFITINQIFSVAFETKLVNVSLPIVYGVMTVIWVASLFANSLYQIERYYNFFAEINRLLKAGFTTVLVISGILFLLQVDLSREIIVKDSLLAISFMILWRMLWHAVSYVSYTTNLKLPRRVLIVSSDTLGQNMVGVINKLSKQRVKLEGIVTNNKNIQNSEILGGFDDDLKEILQNHKIDDVVIALSRPYDTVQAKTLTTLQKLSIPAYIVPSYMNMSLYSQSVESLDDLLMVKIQNPKFGKISLFLKRLLDIMVALTGIILTAPVQLMVIMAIKLESPGPVLFVQERTGLYGKNFKIFKFRSMEINADKRLDEVSEKDGEGRITNHKRPNDPRITRIGKIIRKTSIDELPQLINVLRGDMTLVGPRPELLRIVHEYEPWQRHRFAIRQGITGWWQVNGRSENPCHMSTDQDINYINHFSFLLDIQIMLMTLPAMLKSKGAF